MKLLNYKLLLLPIVMLFSFTSSAQDLTGIWRGYFITEMGENYRLEFQIKLNRSQSVSGVSYSYLDKRFYGKATMSGSFNRQGLLFQIQELKTTEVRSLTGGGTCLMNYKFSYVRSGKEEFLEGTYLGKSEDRVNPANNGEWGDCGGGKVYLRKVTTSDFYIEPFLRDDPPVVKKTPTPGNTTTKKPTTNSTTKKTPPVTKNTTPKTSVPKTQTKPVPKKEETTVQQQRTNEIQKIDKTTEAPKKIVPKKLSIPLQTRSRQNELVKTVVVTNENITVKLYDNGEIDDDTISVYLDNNLILSKKRLSATPISVSLKMDEENADHILVMVAENLGRIPPNTSLMIVHDGDKRYEVRITSTEQKNAMVRFRYNKSDP